MSRYAKDTSVPISRSRAEIDRLLSQWGCHRISWDDDYRNNECHLGFHWERKRGEVYEARFTLKIPKDQYGRKKQGDQLARSSFRVLVLWLKGALNACDHGIIEPEMIFLPWLVDTQGRQFGKAVLPRLTMLLQGPSQALLETEG